MLERDERQKMRKEGFERGKEGSDHWPRQRFAIESRRTLLK